MSWEQRIAENKLFWHITKKENINSIKKNGINVSEGQVGIGVYCIEKLSYSSLDSIIELMTSRGLDGNDLIIVEFIYTGEYYICPVENLIYMNEGWIKIPSNVKSKNLVSWQEIH